MNDHLKPVFTEIIPLLENSGIKYLAYGGVAIAALKGRWVRYNDDLDIAIIDHDFQYAVALLIDLASVKKWKTRFSKLDNGRPKLDLYPDPNRKEQFSIVPIYKVENGIEFRFVCPIILPEDALTVKKRIIDQYSFYTLKDEYLMVLLTHYLKHNKEKLRLGDKKYKDSVAILPADIVKQFYG